MLMELLKPAASATGTKYPSCSVAHVMPRVVRYDNAPVYAKLPRTAGMWGGWLSSRLRQRSKQVVSLSLAGCGWAGENVRNALSGCRVRQYSATRSVPRHRKCRFNYSTPAIPLLPVMGFESLFGNAWLHASGEH
jgi:hypothetical protein